MDQEQAKKIGLLRHQIISPVLMDSPGEQMAYFREVSQKSFEVPGKGFRTFTPTTMKGWLHRYRKRGFSGLVPKTRSDKGAFRALAQESWQRIKQSREEQIGLSCVKFYDLCLKQGLLGESPICIETLRRFLKSEKLYKSRVAKARKRFEMGYFGELWTSDFMHGPQVIETQGAKRTRRSILMAIIDDHSRMITGACFGVNENTKLIEGVFKDAILTHGLPDRFYCDNGPAFSSHYLALVCANLNVGLVHSKPYDSPSRGKIERFFRTVRENFLVELQGVVDLKNLNERFDQWLRGYHQRHHRGIDARPIDRYQASMRQVPRKRISEDSLDEYFLVSVQRSVNKDSTLSLNGTVFEVPPEFIGQRVELRFSQEHPGEVFIYNEGIRVQRIHPVDAQLNAKTYKPSARISDVSIHEIMERSRK